MYYSDDVTDNFEECILLLDSARGIYIPKNFSDTLDIRFLENADRYADDLEICKNPDHEHYWESWVHILDNARIDLHGNGKFYSLFQDGDLFAVIYKD